MKGVRRFQDYLKEQLKDPAFRKAYGEEGIYAELAIQIARLRTQKRLTQRALVKLAHALGKEVKVQFV